MSASFKKIVGIACISMFLQFGVKAQNPVVSQTQSPKSSTSSGNTSSASSNIGNTGNIGKAELNNQLALVSDKVAEKAPDKISSKAASEVKTEKRPETRIGLTIAEPKVSVKNPSIQFKVSPSETKLGARPFSDPDLEILGVAASFQATAYALRGRTRSGAYVRRGVIAADPRVIPLGSVVQIKTPGYSGVYTVHDTGKRIKGKIIDVWVGSSHEARSFGRRRIKLHVLRLGTKGSSNK